MQAGRKSERERMGILSDRFIGSRDNEHGAKLCFERDHRECIKEKGWARGKPSKEEAFVVIQGRYKQSLNQNYTEGEGKRLIQNDLGDRTRGSWIAC